MEIRTQTEIDREGRKNEKNNEKEAQLNVAFGNVNVFQCYRFDVFMT
jgi:hypothetical protein